MRRAGIAWLAVSLLTGCGDSANGPLLPAPGPVVELAVRGLRPLDAVTEGVYEAWVVGPDGVIHSAGRFQGTAGGPATPNFDSPIEDPRHVMISVEPPGDDNPLPSLHKLLGGRFDGTTAELELMGYVTVVGIPLEPDPGTHVLASPSNDAEQGYPSSEDAGLWLYNLGGDTLDLTYYLDFAPLTEGWWYEGWIVHDYGSAEAVWISYGKFRPDGFRQARVRDDTGLGFFSGRRDYEFALGLELHVPGDDWLANPLEMALPGDFALPLDLNGDAAAGAPSRWTHVITIEPWGPDRDAESPALAAPFFLEPYRNAIGDAPPSEPRRIDFFAGGLPRGTARLAVSR